MQTYLPGMEEDGTLNGISRSAWASLAVKSLRLGWPAGLHQARMRLGESYMRLVLLCGLFEDIFPATSELADAVREVNQQDYRALARRETHHGRGWTDRFCELEHEAVTAASDAPQALYMEAKRLGLWLPKRALNCFYTWLQLAPDDPGIRREPDLAPWQGIPAAMLDGHTREGKSAGTAVTVLSGFYASHRKLARLVEAEGWEGVRQRVHGKRRKP